MSTNLRGALFMAISMAGFTINDTFVKLASAEMNAAQIMFVRGAFASALMFLLCWKTGNLRPPVTLRNRAVLGRCMCEMLATVTFLTGLAHMPIGNASAILQALPLTVTMAAALLFGEQVGWRRWAAIVVGFVGVLIIVRPGTEGFNGWSLLIIACVGFATARDLFTKHAPKDVPSAFISLSTALIITITGLFLIAPMGGWSPMTVTSLVWLMIASVFLLFGYQYVIEAMRTGEIGFVAPFRYTSLLWAIGLGYFVLNDRPDWAMIFGATLVVLSGVYAFRREQIRSRTLTEAA
ncbi:MAG: DMT family transporter [Rhizobiaceae bacterium]